MESIKFFPKEGIRSDYGADPNESGNFKMHLSEHVSDGSLPDNITELIKIFVTRQQDCKVQANKRKKKISPEMKAFPLEDAETFWTRMFLNKDPSQEISECSDNVVTKASTSYISFNPKESQENRYKVESKNYATTAGTR